jgi:hypothetical protein
MTGRQILVLQEICIAASMTKLESENVKTYKKLSIGKNVQEVEESACWHKLIEAVDVRAPFI